ncbi:hypothetical protein Neosp_009092 [[Neocosmospora] mangrovei]
MAIYAVSARFASPEVLGGPASSKRFAQLAMNLNKGSDLTIDELKASILLYVYEMSESMRWDTVAEIARITRMAELYYTLHFDIRPGEPSETSQAMMLRNGTVYNPGVQSRRTRDLFAKSEANRSFSNAITDSLQAKMALPAMSVSEFTNPSLFHRESSEDGSQFIKSSAGAKHWETMSMIFSKASCPKISSHSAFSELQELQVLWLTILSKANETVLIVQNWKPGYFKAIDPMCSYLILLAASVLAFHGELSATNASTPFESSEHLDLLQLFLDQMGHNWPLACRLANTLKSLRSRLLGRKPTHKDALNYLFQLTSPLNGTLMSSAEISGDTQSQVAEDVPTFRFPSVSHLIVPEDSIMHFNGELPDNVDPQLQNYQWLDDFDLANLDNVIEGMDPQLPLQHL